MFLTEGLYMDVLGASDFNRTSVPNSMLTPPPRTVIGASHGYPVDSEGLDKGRHQYSWRHFIGLFNISIFDLH